MSKLIDLILEDVKTLGQKVEFHELVGKSVLITGASGMVGTYFLACLRHLSLNLGGVAKVYAIVQSAPSDFLTELADFSGAEIIRGDLSDNEFCKSLPQADFIIHAAGYAQPGRFLADPVKTIKVNTCATFALLDKLNIGGKFLFVSSSEIYSGLVGERYEELSVGTANYTHPRYCYIEGKRCGEAICNSYRTQGVDAKSARLSLAYGPGTRLGDARALPTFIEKALVDNKISLLDNGEAQRTYCYVTDAVLMMWNILLRGTEAVYNVGGESSVTIGDLARQVGHILQVPVVFPPKLSASLAGSPKSVSLDMSRMEKEFGVFPYTDFDTGLKRTINWIKLLFNQ